MSCGGTVWEFFYQEIVLIYVMMGLCNVILGEGIIDSWFHNVGDSKNLKAFKMKLKDL